MPGPNKEKKADDGRRDMMRILAKKVYRGKREDGTMWEKGGQLVWLPAASGGRFQI